MERREAEDLAVVALTGRALALRIAGFETEAEAMETAALVLVAGKVGRDQARGSDGRFHGTVTDRTRTVTAPSRTVTDVFVSSLLVSKANKSTKAETESFESFYVKYPRKVSKKAAADVWRRLSEMDRLAAAAGLERAVKTWSATGTETRFIPHPATWLNQRRWEDSQDAPRTALEAPRGPDPTLAKYRSQREEWEASQAGVPCQPPPERPLPPQPSSISLRVGEEGGERGPPPT